MDQVDYLVVGSGVVINLSARALELGDLLDQSIFQRGILQRSCEHKLVEEFFESGNAQFVGAQARHGSLLLEIIIVVTVSGFICVVTIFTLGTCAVTSETQVMIEINS